MRRYLKLFIMELSHSLSKLPQEKDLSKAIKDHQHQKVSFSLIYGTLNPKHVVSTGNQSRKECQNAELETVF